MPFNDEWREQMAQTAKRDREEVRFEVDRETACQIDALRLVKGFTSVKALVLHYVEKDSVEMEHAMTMYARVTGFNPAAPDRSRSEIKD